MPGLFDSIDEEKRQKLYAMGWSQANETLFGRTLWRCPEDNSLREEKEAFRFLERLEKKVDAKVKER